MIPRNLRHLRLLLAIAETGSVSDAGARHGVSQPAVTQALAKIEQGAGSALFRRGPGGLFPTDAGRILLDRAERALNRLDRALDQLSPRLKLTATHAQLQALVWVAEAESYSLAARREGLAQATLHRAVAQIAREAGRPLFDKTSFGIVATRPCRELAMAVELAMSELDQADTELSELDGRESGRIVVGALPLARSSLLPEALARLRQSYPTLAVTVIDGLYEDLLGGLRRGGIDVLVGALRDPAPAADITQERLFDDGLSILVRPGHPLLRSGSIALEDLVSEHWVLPRQGTPSRTQFDACFDGTTDGPTSIIETGSILLMRELLQCSDMIGCISHQQARAEVARGLLASVDVDVLWSGRPIGLTLRQDFRPTQAQARLLELLRAAASEAA